MNQVQKPCCFVPFLLLPKYGNQASTVPSNKPYFERRNIGRPPGKQISMLDLNFAKPPARYLECEKEVCTWIEKHMRCGKIREVQTLGAHIWTSTHMVSTERGLSFFIKIQYNRPEFILQSQAEGYLALNAMSPSLAPRVFHVGPINTFPNSSFLVLEYVPLKANVSVHDQYGFGRQMAELHRSSPYHPEAQQGYFGFPIDSCVDHVPYRNLWMDDWVEFFRRYRLKKELERCGDGSLQVLGSVVMEGMDRYFEEIQVKPSLLHGMFWDSHIGKTHDGKVKLLNPGCYYGHHEMEFGLNWCTGITKEFYEGYHSIVPRANDTHAKDRALLYSAYYNLMFFNLFGTSYHKTCFAILSELAGDAGIVELRKYRLIREAEKEIDDEPRSRRAQDRMRQRLNRQKR